VSLVENTIEKLRGQQSAATRGGARSVPIGALVPAQESMGARGLADVPASGKVVAVDRAMLREAGFLPEEGFERRMADQYRKIKRPIVTRALESATTGANQLLLVASALPGDGKTFTTINLSLSLSRERDLSVLLVDCDVAKPHVSQLFGVSEETGLLDALADTSLQPESLVIRTDVPFLSVLPAGRPRDGATELLASKRMAEVMAALVARDARRMVVLDSPPLLAASEARPLLDLAGQIVLVVRAGVTPQQAVHDALALLREGQSVGLVLNQGQLPFSETYYGYGSYGSNA
jgi:exopolysaccharide/PEP-CTERM locus tyrosine autokinase